MATNFPTGLDTYTNPISTDNLGNMGGGVGHYTVEADQNDPILALEAKVGINGSAVTTSLDYKMAQLTTGWALLPTLTYVSATTASFPDTGGTIAALLNKGDRLWWIQSATNYYNYIVGISAVSNVTTLTITGGFVVSAGDSSFQNATITSGFYSKVTTPSGFPKTLKWTPTYTNTTTLTSTSSSFFYIFNGFCYSRLIFTFGASTAFTGQPTYTLPTASISYTEQNPLLGDTHLIHNTVADYFGSTWWISTTTAEPVVINAASTYAVFSNISATVPFTFGSGDGYTSDAIYQIA